MRIGGLELEADYPYKGKGESCQFDKAKVSCWVQVEYYSILDYYTLSRIVSTSVSADHHDPCLHGSPHQARVAVTGGIQLPKDEEQIAAWIAENGPTSIGINAFMMQFYMGRFLSVGL